MSLLNIPDVIIDEGIFKYILIKISSNDENKLIVRGYKRSPYHSDIFDEVSESFNKKLKLECLGGGRINHNPENKEIMVYGYSQGFGKANHDITLV
ncbi:unnamed protein product [Gordionus sp. m RMFG-2023]